MATTRTATVVKHDDDLDPLMSVFRLLGDRTRLKILMMLAKGPRNVGSLAEELGMAQPAVSRHLGVLRMCNLIERRPRGKRVFYSLKSPLASAAGPGLEFEVEHFILHISPRR